MKRSDLNWGDAVNHVSAYCSYNTASSGEHSLHIHHYLTEDNYSIRLYDGVNDAFYYAHGLSFSQIDEILQKDDFVYLREICNIRENHNPDWFPGYQ